MSSNGQGLAHRDHRERSVMTPTSTATNALQQFLEFWCRWRPCLSSLMPCDSTSPHRDFSAQASIQSTFQCRSYNTMTKLAPQTPPPPPGPASTIANGGSGGRSSSSSGSSSGVGGRSGKKPEWTAAMNTQLIEWRNDGLSWRDIGARLGISNVGCLKHYRNVVQPALDPSHGWDAHKDGLILHRRLVLGTPWAGIGQALDLEPQLCMARYKVVLEPVLAGDPAAGVDRLESSSVLQAALQKWQWQPEEVLRWYQQRVQGVGIVNTRLPEEWQWTGAMEDRLWAMHQQGQDWEKIATELEMSKDACRRRFKLRFLDKVVVDGSQAPTSTLPPLPPSPSPPSPLSSSSPLSSLSSLSSSSPSISPDDKQGRKEILMVGRPPKDIWTSELDEQLVQLRQQLGLSWREIGSKLCISHVACRRRYETTVWPERTRFWNNEREAELATYLHQGKDVEEIAAAMGENVHPMAVRQQAKAIVKQEQRTKRLREQAVRHQRRDMAERARVGETWEVAQAGELSPATLERFYTNEDWDRLLRGVDDDDGDGGGHGDGHGPNVKESGLSREQLQEAWRQQQGTWTIEQETTLIQQVLQRGLGSSGKDGVDLWRKISSAVGGGHSSVACRIRWKNLDMPVQQTVPIPAVEWPLERELAFWQIWRDERPEVRWDRVARALGEFVTAKECEQYFSSMTSKLLSVSVPNFVVQRVYEERLERLSKAMVLGKGGPLLWTKRRSTQLQSLARVLYGPHWWRRRRLVWRKVARQMGITKVQCRQHWAYLKSAFREEWTREEVEQLERGVRAHGEDWAAIRQEFLPHRTVRAVRCKWFTISDHGAKVTVDEYMTLMGRVEALREQQDRDDGRIDWSDVSSQLPGWTPAPCRRVWESSYASLLEKTVFSAEEDLWLVSNMDPAAPQDWEAVPQQLDSTKLPWAYRLRWCQLMMPVE
ncbi:hypothetical protein DFQ27_007099 [Actinomortierella ambigua]|uniref:Uncharacterized protein n=1 Tax=Actinomortierella ambigua TaxID=1343610 RepID=A0A9P6TZK0_9FUNG|nr:hypothetical protein DFQ27_007099 [Actinomortierella ambigua]